MNFISKTDIKQIIVIMICGFLAMSGCYSAPGQVEAKNTDVRMIPENFSGLAEMVSPAVVNIRTVKTLKGGGRVMRHFSTPFGDNDPFKDFFEKFFGEEQQQRDFKQRSLGSGFIIDKEGYIVTNNHVIEDADEIQVKLKNGDEYDAKIVGRDPNTDLALIQIKPKSDLPFINLGDSQSIKIGQWVLAIGSPFGLEQTVTAGIVSAKGRVIGSGPYDDFIQTDASINPGNSGGPLLNMDGEVIGINTAIIASGQGIGFAVPINLAKGIIDQLKTHGSVTRGWLGVAIQDVTGEVAEYYGIQGKEGALVTEVFPGDPADKAGIKVRDIIIEVNGEKIKNTRDLTRIIAEIGVGDSASVKVLRNGTEEKFDVKIAKREDEKISAGTFMKDDDQEKNELGIRVSNLTPEIARRFDLKDEEGLAVTGVEADSEADKAGLMTGDVIKEINHKAIKTEDDYKEAIGSVKKGDAVQMFIKRMNAGFLVIKMTK